MTNIADTNDHQTSKGLVQKLPWSFGANLTTRGLKFINHRWSAEALETKKGRDAAQEAIAEFVEAGVDVVTNSLLFRVSDEAYRRDGLTPQRVDQDTVDAFDLFNEVVNRVNPEVQTAAVIGPINDLNAHSSEIEMVKLPPLNLVVGHQNQLDRIVKQKPKLIAVETMNWEEAVILSTLCSDIYDSDKIEYSISCVVDDNGNPPGENAPSIEQLEKETRLRGRVAFGINCSTIQGVEAGVRRLLASGYTGTIDIAPNGIIGNVKPDASTGGFSGDDNQVFNNHMIATHAAKLVEECVNNGNGVRVGGCCATNKDYSDELDRELVRRGLISSFKNTQQEMGGRQLSAFSCEAVEPANALYGSPAYCTCVVRS
jgi:S-methylmethionine-dependent homocysteine/selenocysteine methylase